MKGRFLKIVSKPSFKKSKTTAMKIEKSTWAKRKFYKIRKGKSEKISKRMGMNRPKLLRSTVKGKIQSILERELSTQEATESCDSMDPFYDYQKLPQNLLFPSSPKIVEIFKKNFKKRKILKKIPRKPKTEIIMGRFIPNRKSSNLQSLHQITGDFENLIIQDHQKDYS